VSQYQKSKTNLDFTQARNSKWQWHQLGRMQVCTALQTTMPAPHHSSFLQAGCPSCRPTNSVKALKLYPKLWTSPRHGKCCQVSLPVCHTDYKPLWGCIHTMGITRDETKHVASVAAETCINRNELENELVKVIQVHIFCACCVFDL